MSDLDKEIDKAYLEVKKREKLMEKLEKISADILEQEAMLEELKRIKLKEKMDIEVMEKGSFKDIFTLILGKKEELLDIERQEFLWAQMNYLACKRRIRDANVLKEEVVRDMVDYRESENYLKDLLIRKERQLKKSVTNFEEYNAIMSRVRIRKQLIVEIKQAQTLGSTLLGAIADLQIELNQIQNTGWQVHRETLRKFHGKGRTSSYAKKKYVELTQEMVLNLDHLIRKFVAELDDIQSHHQLDYARHLMIVRNFTEIFFDNLITDWVVLEKISSAKKSTENLFSRVERILLMLEHELQTTLTEIEFYEKKKRDFLIGKM